MFKFFWVNKDDDFEELSEEYSTDISDEIEEEVWQVAVDILETETEVIVLSPIAWIEMEDIDLSFHNQVLTIKGERLEPEIYSNNVTIKNRECYWGKFIRNIILPENLDFDDIKANIDNNLLVITIPKLKFPSHNIKIEKI